jgi:NTP pyrophosphatase (non-canonical NTP hydrolase)
MLMLDEYQRQAGSTDLMQKTDSSEWYYVMGLCGEAGEVAELVKKRRRNLDNGKPVDEEEFGHQMLLELGDALWYLAREAAVLGITLEEVAQANLEKLAARKREGTVSNR